MKKILSKQKGYILLESLVFSMILLAMGAAFYGFMCSARMERVGLSRLTALYLIEAQMSYAEELANKGELPLGELKWQGEGEDLRQNKRIFNVWAQTVKRPDALLVTVWARWQEQEETKEMSLEKVIANHVKDNP